MLMLDGFGAYWENALPPTEQYSTGSAALGARFRASMKTQFPYLVTPIQATGRATINKVADANTPRYEPELSFSDLQVCLQDDQYLAILGFAGYYTWLTRRAAFRHLRPTEPLQGPAGARRWWAFAIAAVREQYRRKHTHWSWKELRLRRDQRVEYVKLYSSLIR